MLGSSLVVGPINTLIPQTFEKQVIDDQLGKNDKDKRVNLKGQDLFDESLTIKIGPFRDKNVVWIDAHVFPVMDLKIQVLVAETGYRRLGCALLQLTGDVLMWPQCVVLVQAVVACELRWCRSLLLSEAGAGSLVVQERLLVKLELVCRCWKVQWEDQKWS